VASSPAGGTNGDPKKDYGAVVQHFTYGKRSIHDSRALEFTADGGVILQMFVYPPAMAPAPLSSGSKEERAVTVRGNAAIMIVRTPETSNVHLTTVRWQRPAAGGGVLEWQTQADPRHWDDEKLLDLLEQAAAV